MNFALKTLFCCVFIILSFAVSAQSDKNLSAQSYKHVFANKVFLQIRATFTSSKDTITLFLWKKGVRLPTKSKGAWYDSDEQTLNIQEELYDLCTIYGADSLNALAFVISHELAHARQHRTGGLAECALFSASEIKAQPNAEKLAAETEADIQGLLSARITGFRTIPIHNFMHDFYAKFGLPDVMQNYPTKAERIGFFEKDAQKANQAYALFCGALHLLCANEPDHAIIALEHLYTKEKLTAPEIANNLAAAYLQRVQTSLQQETNFEYNIPLALDSRLRSRTSDAQDRQAKRRILLNRLDTILQNALTQTPNNPALQTNCALYLILKTWNEGKTDDAKGLITAFNANENLSYYGKIRHIADAEAAEDICNKNEKIVDVLQDSISLSANITLKQTANEWLIAIKTETENLSIKGTDGANTKNATDTTACGIRIGSTIQELQNVYGKGAITPTAQHELHLYKDGLLCFYVQNGVVVNWSLVR